MRRNNSLWSSRNRRSLNSEFLKLESRMKKAESRQQQLQQQLQQRLCKKKPENLFSDSLLGAVWPDWTKFCHFRTLLLFLVILNGFISIWQMFELTLANFIWYWANSHCLKWPDIKHIIKPSGHTAKCNKWSNAEKWFFLFKTYVDLVPTNQSFLNSIRVQSPQKTFQNTSLRGYWEPS